MATDSAFAVSKLSSYVCVVNQVSAPSPPFRHFAGSLQLQHPPEVPDLLLVRICWQFGRRAAAAYRLLAASATRAAQGIVIRGSDATCFRTVQAAIPTSCWAFQ